MLAKFWLRRRRLEIAAPVSLEALAADWRAILPLARPHRPAADVAAGIPQMLIDDLYPLTPEDVCARIVAMLRNPYVLKRSERDRVTTWIHTAGDLYDVYQALQYLPDESGAAGLQTLYVEIFNAIQYNVNQHLLVARGLTAITFLTATTTAPGRASLLATAAVVDTIVPGAQGAHDLEAQLVANLATYTPLMHALTALVLKHERKLPHTKIVTHPVTWRWYHRWLP